MISDNEIKELAQLARIRLTEAEEKSLQNDLRAILDYVSKLKEAEIEGVPEKRDIGLVKNVMREDENPHQSEKFTDKLLKEAHERDGDYLVVKKILNNS